MYLRAYDDDIVCILYDFDGVMTDNRVLVDDYGREAVFVNRGDGLAVAKIKEMGILQAVISTETNTVVEKRASKLGIPVIFGAKDKEEVVRCFCNEHEIDLSQVLFIGNDVNDIPAMRIVGFKGAPADAEEEIRDMSDWISTKQGGYGVIRELYDFICKNRE